MAADRERGTLYAPPPSGDDNLLSAWLGKATLGLTLSGIGIVFVVLAIIAISFGFHQIEEGKSSSHCSHE